MLHPPPCLGRKCVSPFALQTYRTKWRSFGQVLQASAFAAWICLSLPGAQAAYVPSDPSAPADRAAPVWDGVGTAPAQGANWTDADLDYLPAWWESWYGTHPGDPDTDDDLILDRDELAITHTDPRLRDTDGNGVDDRSQWMAANGLVDGLEITTPAALPTGAVNVAYSISLAAQTQSPPVVWTTVSGMPAGLKMDATGKISGKPTTAGVYKPTVKAVDAQGREVNKVFGLKVGTSGTPIITTEALLPAVIQGQPFSVDLDAVNIAEGTLTWTRSTGTIPAGIVLSPTGTLTGTPTAAPAKYTFTLKVTDSAAKSATRAFTLYVVSPTTNPLTITWPRPHDSFSGTLALGVYSLPLGQPYSRELTSTGGSGTGRNWRLLDGALPPGMSIVEPTSTTLKPTIAGNPTALGDFFAVIAVTSTTSN